MDRNGLKGECGLETRRFRRELQKAICNEDKKDARYGMRQHRKLMTSLVSVLEYAGIDPSRKCVRDLARMLYEVVEAMESSREHWNGPRKEKEYETRLYTNKEGIRLFQTSTIEADSAASPPPFLSITNLPHYYVFKKVVCFLFFNYAEP
jgi:hypothetical protein